MAIASRLLGSRRAWVGRRDHTNDENATAASSLATDRAARRRHQNALAHPYVVFFHHAVTFAWTHGWLLAADSTATVIYFLSELPVVFLNVSWLMLYHDQTNTRACAMTSGIAVTTYFTNRIALFGLTFVTLILPQIHFFNPLCWIQVALLGLVYLFNVAWWIRLVRKNMVILPVVLEHILALTALPQYNAWMPATCCGADTFQLSYKLMGLLPTRQGSSSDGVRGASIRSSSPATGSADGSRRSQSGSDSSDDESSSSSSSSSAGSGHRHRGRHGRQRKSSSSSFSSTSGSSGSSWVGVDADEFQRGQRF